MKSKTKIQLNYTFKYSGNSIALQLVDDKSKSWVCHSLAPSYKQNLLETVRAVNKAHHKIKLMTQSLTLSLTHLGGIKSTAFQSELSLLLFIGISYFGFYHVFEELFWKKSEKLTAFKKKKRETLIPYHDLWSSFPL